MDSPIFEIERALYSLARMERTVSMLGYTFACSEKLKNDQGNYKSETHHDAANRFHCDSYFLLWNMQDTRQYSRDKQILDKHMWEGR